MIAKCKSISHSGNAIDYAMNKDKSEELYRNGVVGDSNKEIKQEFEMMQESNTRCKNNTFRVEISPTAEDRVNKKDMREILQDHLKEMNLEKHQCIAYIHYDTKTPHIHAVINRVDQKGKAFDDTYISNRFSRTADKIAERRGLTRANEVSKGKALGKDKGKAFEKAHERAVMKYNPSSFEQYQVVMKAEGYNIEKAISLKTGKPTGVRVGKIGEKAEKISSVSRKVGTKLTKTFGKSLMQATPLGQTLSVVSKVASLGRGIDRDKGISR